MEYTKEQIIGMLSTKGEAVRSLFAEAAKVKRDTVGEKIYLRGLIEYSNICRKNCLYCGIRRDNDRPERYTLSHGEVLAAARTAIENRMGSVVLQGGEETSEAHIATIERLIKDIKSLGSSGSATLDHSSGRPLGITLSLGEQSAQTLKRWFDAGAHRYLLRIETSSPELYASLHPQDALHNYETRLKALRTLKRIGYQVGSGVMIGLPGQTVEDLADDILFLKGIDIDMCGMGPYIESENTPLAKAWTEAKATTKATTTIEAGAKISSKEERLEMSLKMVAALRLVMPDINIAATTALASLSSDGRWRAVQCGANVVMPNITPVYARQNYSLYNDKSSDADPRLESLIAYGEWGDPLHFFR